MNVTLSVLEHIETRDFLSSHVDRRITFLHTMYLCR